MIKVVNLVSVIIAPIVVQYSGSGNTNWVVWAIAAALLAVLAWAVMRSKAPAPEMGAAVAAAPAVVTATATKAVINKPKNKKK
jgi:hypothetical protein